MGRRAAMAAPWHRAGDRGVAAGDGCSPARRHRLPAAWSRLLGRRDARRDAGSLPETRPSVVAMKHWLLLYDYVPDYLERRGEHRPAHFEHASASVERGELIAAGAFAEPAD